MNEPTGIEAQVCADIAARQRLGIAKYGCTVADSGDDMLTHGYQEALDLSVYLRAEIERRKWQPIKTAPRDGSDILVYLECATVPIVHIAFYRSAEEWEKSGKYCGGFDGIDDWLGWWSYTINSVGQQRILPTHWMPLPKPPIDAT